MPREATTKLLEMVEEGILDRDMVINACMSYMSEDDVADMCCANDIALTGDFGGEDDEDEDDTPACPACGSTEPDGEPDCVAVSSRG